MLGNRAYVGDFVWNKAGRSEYHRLSGREVKELGKAGEPDIIIVEDNHPPLVDRATWEAVQARRARTPRSHPPVKFGGDWALSGLLVCGHCGARMHGLTVRGRKQYLCGTYRLTGAHGCGRNAVPADRITGFLTGYLQRTFLDPDRMAELRAELSAEAERERREQPAAVARLKAEHKALCEDIDRGARRLLTCDDEDAEDLSRAMKAMRAERVELEGRIAKAGAVPESRRQADEVARAESHLWRLREALESADPMLVRNVFREMVGRVELFWEKRPAGNRRYHFSRGLMYLRQPDGAELRHVYYSAQQAGRR
jgi:site-specific DNA recombinase